MNVLIVDNVTVHLPKLVKLVTAKIPGSQIRIVGTREVTEKEVTNADLVILSGGTGRSIEKNPETYRRVVGIIEKNLVPSIGVCLGAEAIADYFGNSLQQMTVRRVGNIAIDFENELWEVDCEVPVMVYEFHKWKLPDTKLPLVSIARSKDGVEIFRHQNLPIIGLQFHPEVRRKKNCGHMLFAKALNELQFKTIRERELVSA